jgi:hypothetical protein
MQAMPLLTIGTSVAFVGRDGKLKVLYTLLDYFPINL